MTTKLALLWFVLSGAAIGATSCSGDPARDTLARATRWLWSRQSEDGAWRSEQYAVLRSGQALTPFVLFALLDIDANHAAAPPGAIDRALDFVRTGISPDGAIGYGDPELLEYPVYATSYAIRAIVRTNRAEDRQRIAKMANWLADMQYDEGEGFPPDSLVHGGWGFGATGLQPGEPGYMDLAHTRRAIEALRDAGWSDEATFKRARRFLDVVQKQPTTAPRQPGLAFDGGFYFSPAVQGANKGRPVGLLQADSAFFRSYATATSDGILALLGSGVDRDDARVVAARAWLAERPSLAHPAGIPTDQGNPWGDALHFYHLAVRAEVGAILATPGHWRSELARRLADTQQANGSFTNRESVLMKEDDPILATTLAVIALSRAARPR